MLRLTIHACIHTLVLTERLRLRRSVSQPDGCTRHSGTKNVWTVYASQIVVRWFSLAVRGLNPQSLFIPASTPFRVQRWNAECTPPEAVKPCFAGVPASDGSRRGFHFLLVVEPVSVRRGTSMAKGKRLEFESVNMPARKSRLGGGLAATRPPAVHSACTHL